MEQGTVSTELDNSGTTVVSAGEPPILTGVAYTPMTQWDGPALSTTKTRENANTQNPSPTTATGRGTAATRTALRRMERTQTVNTVKMEAVMFLPGRLRYGGSDLNSGIIRNG